VGHGELDTNEDRLSAGHKEEEYRIQHVENPEPFVIDRYDPPVKPFKERSLYLR
jgi:hypothetical protein